MKKIITLLLTVALGLSMAFGVAACSEKSESYSVYVPDGAPALSVAKICTQTDAMFDVNVVNASTINTFVTGEEPKADFALVPVNAAVKLLGSGEKYKTLGTVTHGNLYLLKKEGGAEISSASDLSLLIGSKVGVINLANVPGLVFKLILNQNGVPFNQLTEGVQPSNDAVNLMSVNDLQVVPNSECDYFVVSEPAATTKINATGGRLSLAGSLQTLYGGEEGYPQAVAVVKNTVRQEAVNVFISELQRSISWIKEEETSAEEITSAVSSRISGDMAPTFTAANLSKEVINNCGINLTLGAENKQSVKDFMVKLNAVSQNAWGTPAEAFFF